MLKAMAKEIQEILGNDYAMYVEFNPKSIYGDETLEKYKNIAVLYLNNGNPNFVPDCASMTLYYTLVLYMRIPEGQNTADMTVDPLEKLNKEMTGKLYTENATWNYVLNVGLPTSDGDLKLGGDAQFIIYEVPITAIVTSGVLLTDNTKIKVGIYGTEAAFLQGVITCTEVPTIETESAIFLNAGQLFGEQANAVESIVVAHGWGLHISKLYRPNDPIDVAIRAQALNPTDNKFSVQYAMGNESPVTRNCIVSDVTFANEKGQAVIMSFMFSTGMRSTV